MIVFEGWYKSSNNADAGCEGTDRIRAHRHSARSALSHPAGRLTDPDDASMCCSDTTELDDRADRDQNPSISTFDVLQYVIARIERAGCRQCSEHRRQP